ncbi:hypothetical protein ATE92_2198 [Ulvibacter sp. MAR_2010_11]|nr:hypothetical protein ATE92_2198 [Ulvibacter sp. MAR_2010_11]
MTIIALAFCTICEGQHDLAYVDLTTAEFVTSLKGRDINSWFVTKRYCNGTIEMFKLEDGSMCTSKETYYAVYVFWMDEGKPMIKKIDNCGMYYSLELPDTSVHTFFETHEDELRMGEVKNYETAVASDGPTLRTNAYPCYRQFQFTTSHDTFGQTYHTFDLTNEAKNLNIHYDYNSTLKVVELDGMLDDVIGEMESKFRRQ